MVKMPTNRASSVVVVRARWRPMLRRAIFVVDFQVRGSSTITKPINVTASNRYPKVGRARAIRTESATPAISRARNFQVKRSGTGSTLTMKTTRLKKRLNRLRKMNVP